MNWLTFFITAYLAYGLQLILAAPAWPLRGHEPILLLILLVFIGLQAPAMAVAWSAIILGILADLLFKQHEPGLIGPWAIGFLAAGYSLVQLRNLLFRDSMFTIGIMTLVAGIFALLVVTMLHALRGVPIFGNEAVGGFKAAEQLYRGFFTLVSTAIFALPVGYGLLRLRPLWGFSGRSVR